MRHLKKRVNIKDKKTIVVSFVAGLLIGLLPFLIYKVNSRKPVEPGDTIVDKAYPKKAQPEARPLGRIAIVLDDFGYNYKNIKAIFNLDRPVTFSILPNLAYSGRISRDVRNKKYEAILHLPMEPYEEGRTIRPETSTVRTSMSEEEVLEKIGLDLDSVGFVKGVSNHQGSKATEDAALIDVVFKELKRRDLFFLDSLVTSDSVCKAVAREARIGFAQRDVFLDNEKAFEYIKGQMRQLIKIAKKYGSAIGVGHDRTTTVLALSRLMPEAEAEGIEFVFLSELVK